MDKIHQIIDELSGAEGVSQNLYALLGHGRWLNLATELVIAHANKQYKTPIPSILSGVESNQGK